jgi:hypothetical protein
MLHLFVFVLLFVGLQYPDVPGSVDEDLPNSWECPKCCKEGRNANYKVGYRYLITWTETANNQKQFLKVSNS